MFFQFLLAFSHTAVYVYMQQTNMNFDTQVALAPSNQVFAIQSNRVPGKDSGFLS